MLESDYSISSVALTQMAVNFCVNYRAKASLRQCRYSTALSFQLNFSEFGVMVYESNQK